MAAAVCPTCKREMSASETARGPFCSARCRAADLGNWLSGQYRISSAIEESEDEILPAGDREDVGTG
jgi:endogenous inhibitor of DNA gyrase (YacG/DUF329 family)